MAGLIASTTWWFREVAPHAWPTDRDDFWWGVVHGTVSPFDLIYKLIDGRVEIYQVPNSGVGYSFGFLIGVLILLGTLSLIWRLCR